MKIAAIQMVSATRIEDNLEVAHQLLGQAAAQGAELATTTVDKVTETAERTFEAVKQEAAAQGLTPQAARAGAAAVGAKLKTVAKTARDQTAKAKST